MPHLTLEYSANLATLAPTFNPAAALAAINRAAFASGLFGEADIKSRALACEQFCIGVEAAPRAFAHLRVALLSGRSGEERRQLAAQLLAAQLLAALKTTVNGENGQNSGPAGAPISGSEIQLSVETCDLDRPSYAKDVLHG